MASRLYLGIEPGWRLLAEMHCKLDWSKITPDAAPEANPTRRPSSVSVWRDTAKGTYLSLDAPVTPGRADRLLLGFYIAPAENALPLTDQARAAIAHDIAACALAVPKNLPKVGVQLRRAAELVRTGHNVKPEDD